MLDAESGVRIAKRRMLARTAAHANGTAIMPDFFERAMPMEAEHVNAIGTAIAGLKDRTAQLRRYL
jgi:hypothetical protein